VCDDPAGVLPKAKLVEEVRADATGFVRSVDAMEIALGALRLGAGRIRAEDTVDHTVGYSRLAKIGDAVAPGTVIGVVHAGDQAGLDQARAALRRAVTVSDTAPAPEPLVAGRVDC
jgi:thymidine phosphorylase